MQGEIMYECGCLAGGDNAAASCPIHGYSILQPCKHIGSCEVLKYWGGFPTCYDPWKFGGNICKDYEAE